MFTRALHKTCRDASCPQYAVPVAASDARQMCPACRGPLHEVRGPRWAAIGAAGVLAIAAIGAGYGGLDIVAHFKRPAVTPSHVVAPTESLGEAKRPILTRAPIAGRSGLAARVLFTVASDGHVIYASASTSSGDAAFDSTALASARTWTFAPLPSAADSAKAQSFLMTVRADETH